MPEDANQDEHAKSRDRIAAMEKALSLALVEAGYEVMNTVHCRAHLDAAAFGVVRAGFAAHFKNLAGESGKS